MADETVGGGVSLEPPFFNSNPNQTMATAAACNTLIAANFIASCNGLNKVGGIDGTVYIGYRPDIATLALTAGAITTFTLGAGKKLAKFGGKKEQHEITCDLIPMKGVNMKYKHSAKLYLYPFTQADTIALENLLASKRMFLIYVNLQGQAKALGIDLNPFISTDFDDERGLAPTSEKWTEGINYNADSWSEVVLEGEFWSKPKTYFPAASLATTIAALDAMCYT
jgi:hypothetical protein